MRISSGNEVARICGYDSKEHFMAKKPSMLETQHFKKLVADRTQRKIQLFHELSFHHSL